MFNTHGLIAVLILALINAKTAVTENDYYPGKFFFIKMCSISASLTFVRTLHLFLL